MNRCKSRILFFSILIFAVTFSVSLGISAVISEQEVDSEKQNLPIEVVFIGASIGENWDLPGLPSRTGNDRYHIKSFAVYKFDKSNILKEVLSSESEKPDIIIIKECASYFPGNLSEYSRHVRNWVSMCREKGIKVILATTVPVVKSFPLRIFFFSLFHLKFRWPGDTFDGIIEYNDWLIEYAEQDGITVLDLEAALRSGNDDRYLNSDFAQKDGLHINQKGYEKLDSVLLKTLDEIDTDLP